MNGISERSLILEEEVFSREQILRRMEDGSFNSLAKFELFIWDLEMFLQLQRKLGGKIILKGGAATQFYIPISAQRTSIDIDMLCLASREEVRHAIEEIEAEMNGEGDYCKFMPYKPNKPKLGLDDLETYYVVVPSICQGKELYAEKGKQQVKIEFLYSGHEHDWNTIRQPELFALETEQTFNVLTLASLFADKLTTLGPNTIGISDERADEQFKQVYDVITLFLSNLDQIIGNRELVRTKYEETAYEECRMHGIPYEPDSLLKDMKMLLNRVKNIEYDSGLWQHASNFQSLYLRRTVSRDQAQWAIVGYQLELLINYIFSGDRKIVGFRKVEALIEKLQYASVRGPDRGRMIQEARATVLKNFGTIPGLSPNLFKKRFDRIIWELTSILSLDDIEASVSAFLL